ncbi:patched domain-containing 2 [Elysia marginata]|uniref:Patched domain-containing 2 n=1 Tax=Elysia marginata TaxID=1093978 RepID=A0AAV4J6Q3_9GAST|nr:patched domain-containing 2 [Elysia marginata]
MRWWSLFHGQRSQGWMPVSNADDPDETGMDDLMRMAQGYYQDDGDEDESDNGGNNSSSLQLQRGGYRVAGTDNDDDQPVFCRPQSSIWSSVVGLASSRSSTVQSSQTLPVRDGFMPSAEQNMRLDGPDLSGSEGREGELPCHERSQSHIGHAKCCRQLGNLNFPPRRWYFILLSLVIAVVFIGLNVGLGIYSLVFYNPDQLVIDKSVKSFSIPNHKAYRNFEALMLARKDNSSHGRYRRDSVFAEKGQNLKGNSVELSLGRSKREALLAKEEKMLKHTASVLQKLNLKNTGFSRKAKDILPPSLFSSRQTTSPIGSGVSNVGSLFHRHKRSSRRIDCMFDYQSIARWKMHLIYLAQGDEELNMFTKERLQTAHDIEQRIIQHPNFNNFCLRDPHLEIYDPAVRDMNGCVPLNSLLTYFFPSVDTKGNVYYDGLGTNIDDVDSALKLAMNHETFYYYVDDKINKTYQKSYLLRSEVLFGAPLAGYSCIGTEKKDQDKKFKDFVVTYIDLLSKASTDKVQVLYGGNEIFDYEVATTFWGDVHLAMVSLIAIFVLMLVLSLSLYLTVLGVVVISLSFPMSLFFYRVVFGINALGILNGAAAFVIIGIGVDDVFVFVNIYRQASHMKDPAARIMYTLRTAGVATFFTSFTTAAAFAANLASAIPAVYEFGLFMSLIVSSCWLSVFVLMPPMLYLHACCFEPLEKMLFSCFSCSRSESSQHGSRSTRGSSTQNLSLQQYYRQQEAMGRGLYPDDGDVAMLDIADIEPNEDLDLEYDPLADDDMLLIDDPYRDAEESGRQQPVLTLSEEYENNYTQGKLTMTNKHLILSLI